MREFRIIELSGGKMVAVIDAKDYRRVNRISWHIHKSRGSKKKVGAPYARGQINGKKVYLHRFIMDAPEYMHVDHINHCTLDCRRANLSITTPTENVRRTRRHKRA